MADPATCKGVRLQALPVHVIPYEGGVALRRGSCLIRLSGEGAAEAWQLILAALGSTAMTRDEICNRFPVVQRAGIASLLEQLISARIVVPASEDTASTCAVAADTDLDIFYWNFRTTAEAVNSQISQSAFVVLGVNHVSDHLISTLLSSGIRNITLVDFPSLRNLRLLDNHGGYVDSPSDGAPILPLSFEDWSEHHTPDSFSCLIGTADFSSTLAFRQLNDLCHRAQRPFFPVQVAEATGYIGPLVMPDETACYECYWRRRNSHLNDPVLRTAVEEAAFDGQRASGFHPAMASLVASLAVLELTKVFSGRLPLPNVGTSIEVHGLHPKIVTRKVLKSPRCPVCSPLLNTPSITPYKHFLGPAARPRP